MNGLLAPSVQFLVSHSVRTLAVNRRSSLRLTPTPPISRCPKSTSPLLTRWSSITRTKKRCLAPATACHQPLHGSVWHHNTNLTASLHRAGTVILNDPGLFHRSTLVLSVVTMETTFAEVQSGAPRSFPAPSQPAQWRKGCIEKDRPKSQLYNFFYNTEVSFGTTQGGLRVSVSNQ